MSKLDRIVACAIHPAIGIARLGKSASDFYLAPEVPGADADPGNGSFKDANGEIKREGVRFRIYGYAADGSVVKELSSADADIVWRVHVANRKAAEWIIKQGGFVAVTILDGGNVTVARQVGDLPRQPFRVTDINITNAQSEEDPPEELFQLTDVTRVFIEATQLKRAPL